MELGASFVGDLDNLKATELRLGLPGSDIEEKPVRNNKRALLEDNEDLKTNKSSESCRGHKEVAPVAKAQVVGWPPIRSYRKNCFQAAKKEELSESIAGLFVKVSMDGAPYLRKIDLKVYKGYKELRQALEEMFKCFSLGDLQMDGCNRSEHAIAYEDKDGDLMLAGDVPWEMFITSCKRLRIMKGSDARGLGSSN